MKKLIGLFCLLVSLANAQTPKMTRMSYGILLDSARALSGTTIDFKSNLTAPAYQGNGTNITSRFSWLSDSLTRFVLDQGRMGTGTGYLKNIKTVHMGDSHTAYTWEFAEKMWKAFGNAGLGWESFGLPRWPNSSYDTVQITAGWTNTDEGATDELWGIDGNSIGSSSTSDSARFASNMRFNYVRIWYAQNTDKGTFVYRIDGGAPVTVDCNGTAGLAYVTIGGLSYQNHVVTVKVASGTVILYGLDIYVPTMQGYTPYWLHNGGSTAAQWQARRAYLQTFLSVIDPAAVFVGLGANDAGASTPAATYQTYITTIVTAIQNTIPKRSIVLITGPRRGDGGGADDVTFNTLMAQYETVNRNLAVSYGLSYFSLYNFFPLWTMSNSLGLTTDAVHMNDIGYEIEARAMMKEFAPEAERASLWGPNSFRNGIQNFYAMDSTTYPIISLRAGKSWTGNPLEYYNSAGTRVYYVDYSGILYLAGQSIFLNTDSKARLSGALGGAFAFNYGTGATGNLSWYGGSAIELFDLTNAGTSEWKNYAGTVKASVDTTGVGHFGGLFLSSDNKSRISGATGGEVGFNYGTSSTGELRWYGGLTTPLFAVSNTGTAATRNYAGVDKASMDTSGVGRFVFLLLSTDSKAKISGATGGAVGINYNTAATGGLDFYGGGTSSVFSVDNTGILTVPVAAHIPGLYLHSDNKSKIVGVAGGGIGIDYNTAATGSIDFYGGGTTSVFGVTNTGVETIRQLFVGTGQNSVLIPFAVRNYAGTNVITGDTLGNLALSGYTVTTDVRASDSVRAVTGSFQKVIQDSAAYAGVYIEKDTKPDSISITDTAVWYTVGAVQAPNGYKWTTDGVTKNCTIQDSSITINATGVYRISYVGDGKVLNMATGNNLHFHLYVNDVALPNGASDSQVSATNAYFKCGGEVHYNVTKAGTIIKLKINSPDDSSGTVIFNHGSLVVTRVPQ